MLKIGLTGGIGSGKTTVATIFNSFGIPVYNSDVRAKYIMNTNTELIDNIKKLLGEDAYKNKTLNRDFISKAIFNSKELLQQLNALVHPKVAEDFNSWCTNHSESSFVIKESAILIESNAYKNVDKIIVVNAPIDIRIKRVSLRDNSNESEIKARINNQISEEKRNQFADFLIHNDNQDSLIFQVQNIIKELKPR